MSLSARQASDAVFGAKRWGEECDAMQAFVREHDIGGAAGYGRNVFDLVREEILTLRARLKSAGTPHATCLKCYACPEHVTPIAAAPPGGPTDGE